MIDDPENSDDAWLTLAEIAAQLRLNPSTVRAWVSKGQLPAQRAGLRKWMVRRSDLQRMLADGSDSAGEVLDRVERGEPGRLPRPRSAQDEPRRSSPSPPRGGVNFPPAIGSEPAASERTGAVKQLQSSLAGFQDAMAASAFAAPSPGYLGRLEAIAEACARLSDDLLRAAQEAGVTWRPRVDGEALLAYELQANGNRLGEPAVWQQFDQVFEGLVITLASTDVQGVALGFLELADALTGVVGQLRRAAEPGRTNGPDELRRGTAA